MLEWHDFVEQLLSEESSFDGISLSFDGTAHSVGVPPIIKASVLMLDKMITHQGKFNILVFPERIQSIFIFTLIKLLHNIAEGKIERAYDPEAFKPGEKLKLGNAVVEFVGIEDEKNERRMKIKVADLTISAPIEYFPLFQLTNTQRRLSPYEKYVVEKKKIEGLVSHLTADEKFLKMLADYRTHMDSSIVSMTSVINAKELLSTCKLCGRDIKSILLVGQADYEGNVKNVGAGQLGGVPAVVLASDLYAIAALADQGHPIQSIIIDGSNANILLSQMDALDNLMRLGVPITCVTDIVNSFDLQPFLDRQFNVWRWDETSITDHLYNVNPLSSDRKIKHCAKREVKYLVSDGNEISIAIRILAALLMALTLVTKAIQHNPIGNDYLCFLIMLLLFPCVMRRCEGDVSFYRITIFFACGIITAALTAQQIATFPNISQFIKVDSYLTVTRLSGFYGDPNFYSAHIAACLAGTQLLLCHEKSRRRQIVLAILALVLLYCGLLSASKSFIIVTACLFLLWVPILLEKGTFSSHFRLFVGLLCAGIIIASSSAFRALLQIVDDRFAQASNLSELTTGRTDLWRNYIHEFLNNPITLLFGEGYTSINLNNKASHNTLIQVVYQFGLIGMPLLISWVVISLRNLFTQLNAGHVKWKHALLMCVGVVLPWMGIDILQFDEFFLLPVYAVIGIAYSTRSTENKKLESSKGEI